MHDTLADRSVAIPMRRRRPDEPVERLRLDDYAGFDDLRRQAARWAEDHLAELRGADPSLPEELHDRARDNWRHLIAIADLVGGEWPTRAHDAARRLSVKDDIDDASTKVMLLTDMRTILAARQSTGAPHTDSIATANLLAGLHAMEERPWPSWRRDKPMTARQLADLLRPFEINSGTRRFGDMTVKGYPVSAFTDAFDRYLDPILPSHRHNPQKTAKNGHGPSGTAGFGVTDRETSKPAESVACDGVTDEMEEGRSRAANPGSGELWENDL
jgi:putative DNA primase/helicase